MRKRRGPFCLPFMLFTPSPGKPTSQSAWSWQRVLSLVAFLPSPVEMLRVKGCVRIWWERNRSHTLPWIRRSCTSIFCLSFSPSITIIMWCLLQGAKNLRCSNIYEDFLKSFLKGKLAQNKRCLASLWGWALPRQGTVCDAPLLPGLFLSCSVRVKQELLFSFSNSMLSQLSWKFMSMYYYLVTYHLPLSHPNMVTL